MKARSVFAALALTALVAGCGAPGDDGDDTASKATPAATAAAKPDISKVGNVTLTIWDQEVRGGQKAQIEELNKQFDGEVPERQGRADREVVRGHGQDVKLGGIGPERAGHRPGQPGPPDHGRAGEGQTAAPDRPTTRRSTAGRTATPRRCSTSTSSRRTARNSAPASCTGSRRWARSWASSTTRRRSPTPPTTLAEFEASLEEAKAAGETPIHVRQPRRSGRASTTSRACSARSPTSRPCATSCSRRRARTFDTPEFQAGRHEAPGVGRQGLLQQELQRHRLRPGVGRVREGQQPLSDRRHVADGRPREGDGRQRRLHAVPRQRSQRAGRRSAARACRTRSRRRRRTRMWRPRTSTS